MKKFIPLLISILITFQSSAQVNLVPNSSFEDTLSCPTGGSAIDLAIGWSSYCGSADYFNSCNNSIIGVPSNFAGYQYARDGNAYSGIFCYYSPVNDIREFIGIQISQSLTIGEKYFVSFYTAMGFHIPNNRIGIGINNLGIKMSTVPYSTFNPTPIDNIANINSNSIILDSTNWVKISGSFVADSAYNYLIIGNFFTDSASAISIIDSSAIYSYYYIDQVTLSTDSALVNNTSEPKTDNSIFTISPNPSPGQFIISGDPIESFFISNILGEIIYENTNKNNLPINIDISNLGKGVYFLKSHHSNLILSSKIIVY